LAKRLVKVAFVEKRFVVVAWDEVELIAVKFWRVVEEFTRSVEAVMEVAETSVPLIFAELTDWLVTAPRVVLPAVRVVAKRFVLDAVVAKKFVVVAAVPVALRKVKFWRVEEPVTRRFESVPVVNATEPKVAFVAKRFVELAVVAKKLVVVAFVDVELSAVKFWRVEEPVTRRLERVERPPVAVKVVPTASDPVKLAAELIVWPLMRPEVTAPRVVLPAVRAVANKFVELAVVAKKFVVVAEVPVAAVKVKA